MTPFSNVPLMVVALGGNAVSPPRGGLTFAVERSLIDRAIDELVPLARGGWRLLVVHGNGPQVGRLLVVESGGATTDLDVCVAQTQGELGYLIVDGLDMRLGEGSAVAVVTRVLVDESDAAFAYPTKPIGAVLDQPPPDAAAVRMADGSGWRRVVASPRPLAVIERAAVERLLAEHHVVAGGGGGIAMSASPAGRRPQAAVIDKDWVASLFAVGLRAERLLYVTDVPHVFDRFGYAEQEPLGAMTIAAARARLAQGVFAPGSMAPKVESAVQFAEATGRPAVITTIGAVEAALRGEAGTTIEP